MPVCNAVGEHRILQLWPPPRPNHSGEPACQTCLLNDGDPKIPGPSGSLDRDQTVTLAGTEAVIRSRNPASGMPHGSCKRNRTIFPPDIHPRGLAMAGLDQLLCFMLSYAFRSRQSMWHPWMVRDRVQGQATALPLQPLSATARWYQDDWASS